MPLTVRELLDTRGMGLRLRAGEVGLDRSVEWVHVTELVQPGPWLEGGEAVLTTGLGLAALPAEAYGSYVAGLVAAGVVALGFGVGVHFVQTPPALVDAAAQHAMPLFEVPAELPFIAIIKGVANRLAEERYAAVERMLDTQQRMTRSAVGKGVPGVLAAFLAAVDGWGVVLDSRGRVIAARPADALERGPALWTEIRRVAQRGRVNVARETSSGYLVLQSLGAGDRARGYLAVGSPRRHGEVERLLVNHATSLLSFELEKSRAVRRSERRLGETLLESFFAGGLPTEQVATYLGLFGFASGEPVSVLVLRPRRPSGSLLDAVEEALQEVPGPAMMCSHGTGAVVLLAGEGERADDVAERVAAATPGRLHAGLSASVGADRLPLALYEANSAANSSQTGGQQTVVVRFHSLGTTALLLTLLSREALGAIVNSLLGPVSEYDARTGAELLRSLRTFLRHDARWEEAAAELHIHRHTLRYRLQKIEALTSRNLTSAQSRSEFWLALEAQALLEQSGGVGLPSAMQEWTATGTTDRVVVEAAGAWGRVGVQTAASAGGGGTPRP